MDQDQNQKNVLVVQQAIRIASVLNKHLSEANTNHTIKEIAAEAFE